MVKLKLTSENQQVLSNKNHPNGRLWLIDLLGLCACIVLFYTLWLGSYPLFTPDEGRYSEVAREMIATSDYITPRVDGIAFLDKPILYYWLQVIAIQLFGLKEWALRFFPAMLGMLSCLFTYACGRRLFNRPTGLLAAAILATTPLYFGGTHYANLDLEVAALITCTMTCLIMGMLSEDNTKPYFLFGAYLFAGLAFLTKGLIGFAFPFIIASSWIVLLKRWDLFKKVHLIKGCLFAIGMALPWYILVQQANPQFLHFFFVTQQVARFLSAAEFNNPTPFWFYAPIVILGFFPWTIFLLQALTYSVRKVWNHRKEQAALLYLLLWFSIIFVFFSIPHCKTMGYIFPVFPPLALLVANYLCTQWNDTKPLAIKLSYAALTLIGAALGTAAIALHAYQLIELTPACIPYLNALATIFIGTGVGSLLLLNKRSLLPLFLLCLFCSIMTLLTLTLGAAQFNMSSAKPLVMDLKKIIRADDEVANFYKYYYDVPLYLEKRVTIVANWNAPDIINHDNWIRELWFGMPFQKTDDWLINKEKFYERWHSDKRMFVFLNTNYLSTFKRGTNRYFVVSKHNNTLLLSNQPVATLQD